MSDRWQHEIQPNNYERLARLALVLVLAFFLVLVYSHENAKDVPLSDIEGQLLEQTNLGTLKACDERDLLHFLGIDYEAYEEFIYYKSGVALGVDELLIIKATDRSDLDAAEDAVESRLASQKKAFDGYGTTQMQLLQKAVVTKQGNYLFYCVASDSDQYEEVFRHAIQ